MWRGYTDCISMVWYGLNVQKRISYIPARYLIFHIHTNHPTIFKQYYATETPFGRMHLCKYDIFILYLCYELNRVTPQNVYMYTYLYLHTKQYLFCSYSINRQNISLFSRYINYTLTSIHIYWNISFHFCWACLCCTLQLYRRKPSSETEKNIFK